MTTTSTPELTAGELAQLDQLEEFLSSCGIADDQIDRRLAYEREAIIARRSTAA